MKQLSFFSQFRQLNQSNLPSFNDRTFVMIDIRCELVFPIESPPKASTTKLEQNFSSSKISAKIWLQYFAKMTFIEMKKSCFAQGLCYEIWAKFLQAAKLRQTLTPKFCHYEFCKMFCSCLPSTHWACTFSYICLERVCYCMHLFDR